MVDLRGELIERGRSSFPFADPDEHANRLRLAGLPARTRAIVGITGREGASLIEQTFLERRPP